MSNITDKEMKDALDGLEQRIKGATESQVKQYITEASESLAQKMKDATEEARESAKKEFESEVEKLKADFDAKLAEKQKHLDSMDVRLKAARKAGEEAGEVIDNRQAYKRYVKGMTEALSEKVKDRSIASISKGRSTNMVLKDITLSGNLTGTAVQSYQPGVAAIPMQRVNFADLVPTVQSATGIYVLYREGAVTGAVAEQATENTAKADVDPAFTEVVYNATYLAGITRFSKQMATDLPFLRSFLPMMLRREYFKVENSTFYSDLQSAATLATTTASTGIERIVNDIGEVENTDYDVNGVLLNPVDWANIASTAPSDFSLPATVQFVNGTLTVHGVPVFKASWVGSGEYMLGDWNMAKKVVVDGLAVEFFEQDRDNVPNNMITARIESRTVLAIDRPDAFIRGNLTGAQPV